MDQAVDADELLDSMRGLVIVVLGDGKIEAARGGFGGFLGLDVASLPGTNVFDYVSPADGEELALYFIENIDESEATIALPMSFRMGVVGSDGYAHPVDAVPTGKLRSDGSWSWVVLLVPVALNGSMTRSLDLEMSGASRERVRTMLCEELRVDNDSYINRWVMIELEGSESPKVIVAREEDRPLADAVAIDLRDSNWTPWADLGPGAIVAIDTEQFPDRVRSVMLDRRWQRAIVAPVFVGDRLSAAYLLVGRVPHSYDAMEVKRNVSSRIRTLVRATAMLVERWDDQDRLQIAASTDELTGLVNRRELFTNLTEERGVGSLLYIDVDDFKSINDRYGHAVGDAVLVNLARRIESACRSEDRIGRVGGDEFVVVLPDADRALAEHIAARIVKAIAEPLDFESGPLDVSVSVGHAPLDAEDPLDLADHAMLRAKRSRRELVKAVDPS